MSDQGKDRPTVMEDEYTWCDSNTFIPDPNGNLIEAGTCLKLNDTIILLKHLTPEQLIALRQSVQDSVAHELSKREIL
jgi:hypothetical protein